MSATSSKKDRAAVGLLQQPFPRLLGPGEGPADVAEKLALGQRRAERGHVHRHERPVRAAAVAMDRPGDELLARAALAADVDAGVRRRDQRDPLENLLHRRTAADDPVSRVFRWRAGGRLDGPRSMLQRAFDRPLGHRQIERFREVIEGPIADRGHGGGEVAVGGHDDDRHARRGLLEVLHGGQSVHARQADVQHDHVGPILAGRGESLFGRDGGRRPMAELLGQLGQAPADALFVVDDQEVGHGEL